MKHRKPGHPGTHTVHAPADYQPKHRAPCAVCGEQVCVLFPCSLLPVPTTAPVYDWMECWS